MAILNVKEVSLMLDLVKELEAKAECYKEMNKKKTEVEKFTFSITTEDEGIDGVYLLINADKLTAIELFKDTSVDINGICGGEIDESVAVDIIKTIVKITKHTILFDNSEKLIHAFKLNDNGEVIDIYEAMFSELNENKELFTENSSREKIQFRIFTYPLSLVINVYDKGEFYGDMVCMDIKDETISIRNYEKLRLDKPAIVKLFNIVEKHTGKRVKL